MHPMRKLLRVANSMQVRPRAVDVIRIKSPIGPEIYVIIISRKIKVMKEIFVYLIL